MSNRVISLSLAGTLLAGAAVCSGEHNPTLEGKKLIKMFGLDKPTTAYRKENIEHIRSFGLDGLCIVVLPNPGTHELNPRDDGNYLWHTSIPQTREEYSDAVRDLNEIDFQRMDYNILQYCPPEKVHPTRNSTPRSGDASGFCQGKGRMRRARTATSTDCGKRRCKGHVAGENVR